MIYCLRRQYYFYPYEICEHGYLCKTVYIFTALNYSSTLASIVTSVIVISALAYYTVHKVRYSGLDKQNTISSTKSF